MKRLVILAIAVAIGAGRTQRTADPSTGTSDGDDRAGGAANQTPDGRVGHTGDRPQIYAAVIRQLVTKDHTFGRGTSPFKRVYVVDGAVEDAGNPGNISLGRAPGSFTDELKQRLKDELADLPPLEFIADPDDVRRGKQGMGGVKKEGVIITLGPVRRMKTEMHVPNALWCGGLCGQWLTYVLKNRDGTWTITGTTGPTAIS